MRNIKFPGIEEDLTAPNTPWIYYGVGLIEYDMARAFLQVLI